MEYLVLTATHENAQEAGDELGREVTEYLNLGWEPVGGVSVVYQALERDEYSAGIFGYYTAAQAIVHQNDEGPLPQ